MESFFLEEYSACLLLSGCCVYHAARGCLPFQDWPVGGCSPGTPMLLSKQAHRTPSISTFLVTLWNRQGKMRETRCLEVPEISEALQGSLKTVSLLFDSRLPSPTRPSDTLVLTLI